MFNNIINMQIIWPDMKENNFQFSKDAIDVIEKLLNRDPSKRLGSQNDADEILKKAMPTLNAAIEALNTLNRADIAEIKQNNNPHPLVLFTL